MTVSTPEYRPCEAHLQLANRRRRQLRCAVLPTPDIRHPISVHHFVVTNDFPPRIGGINYYVDQLMRRFPAGTVTIFSSRFEGWQAFDRDYPHEVIRIDTEMMLPVPWVRRRLHDELRSRKPDTVVFGATWPLGHLGPAIKR